MKVIEERPDGDRDRKFFVECDCGTRVIVRLADMRQSKTTSCGCSSRQNVVKLFRRVAKTKTCWIWNGCRSGGGYSQVRFQGRKFLVHRIFYELFVGPIPKDLEIDHLCRTRACVNPKHLEPVTSQENTLRGISPAAVNARRTHCKHGHPLSGDNLYIEPKGKRRCRICNRQRSLKNSYKRFPLRKPRQKRIH